MVDFTPKETFVDRFIFIFRQADNFKIIGHGNLTGAQEEVNAVANEMNKYIMELLWSQAHAVLSILKYFNAYSLNNF